MDLDKMQYKKAAIISSYAYIRGHNNYGSLLQYFALQQYLKKHFNIDAFWVRYMFPAREMYMTTLKKCIRSLLYGFHPDNIWRHFKTQIAFRHFMHEHCNISPTKYDSIDKLKQFPPKADLYITGSDQVWGGWLEPNYLTFAPQGKKRIAYAASFGKKELTEEHQLHIQSWIQSFDAVSVREASGVEICGKMGIEAQHLPDPTLLVDDNDYLPADVKRIERTKYIFCYFINEKDPEYLRIKDIIDYSRTQKARLKITGIEGPETVIPSKYLHQYSPEAWLNHYKYAECIFTNTFHGTVFCIIFRKPFCVLFQKGNTIKQNERLHSILTMFGLQERIITSDKSIKEIMEKPINWDRVEEIKQQQRMRSDLFWQKILNR